MSFNILSKLARFNLEFDYMRRRNPNLTFRYVLSKETYDEIIKYATYRMTDRREPNGKNYIFGVEFRVDPNLKGIIMAEVIDEAC